MILEPFYPKEWVDSVYGIDWEQWRERGIRGAIFDIDNTLVPHGKPETKEADGATSRSEASAAA